MSKVDETYRYKAGEVCSFPVKIRVKGTYSHYRNGRRVVDKTTGYAKVTNTKKNRSVKLDAKATFRDYYSRDRNSTHSTGSGNQLFWGTVGFAEHPKPTMLYVQGRTTFRLLEVKRKDGGDVVIDEVRGRVINLCYRLR